MNRDANSTQSWNSVEPKVVRLLSTAGLTLYPLWFWVYHFLDANFYDPLSQRLLIGAGFGLIFGLSFLDGLFKRKAYLAFIAWTWVMTAHFMMLTYQNSAAYPYVIGSLVVIVSSSATHLTSSYLRNYHVYSTLLCGFLAMTLQSQNALLLFFSQLTIGFVKYLALNSRISLMKKLERRSAELHAVFISLPDALLTLDPSGTLLNFQSNDDSAKAWNLEKLMGENFLSIFDAETRSRFEDGIMATQMAGTSITIEFEGDRLRKKGYFEARLHETPHQEIVVLLRDITEKKRQDEFIKEQQAKMVAGAHLSSLGEVSAGIAHEINNPLAIIRHRAEIIGDLAEEKKMDVFSRISKSAVNILKHTDRITAIVHGLQTFARDGNAADFEEVDLVEILKEVVAITSERFRNHGIYFEVKLPESIAAECQKVRVGQVIINLLNNAYDAVNESKEEHKTIVLQARVNYGEVEIRVINSGPRLLKSAELKIFQPFYTTKPVGKGTGLGLSISRGIIEDHQGSLSLEDVEGMTCFCVRFPQAQNNQKVAG